MPVQIDPLNNVQSRVMQEAHQMISHRASVTPFGAAKPGADFNSK